ncbi:transposase IS605 OrfB [Sulfolobus islandicus Y.G.57.14]|uniref:Transposase IS605 OrfB n=1 Tax=Saccharolobus islandicus (strain Y.G.57.14 / Yellowstone \|nr:transposase IS605 OrfB [Sulfolobus islandicus Y.G.57.14]
MLSFELLSINLYIDLLNYLHLGCSLKDKQLRLRIYRSAFSSMKNAIIEKAREFGVPVILVNPSHTSTVCPVHGAKIVYQPDGGNAPRVGVCEKGKEKWHRGGYQL